MKKQIQYDAATGIIRVRGRVYLQVWAPAAGGYVRDVQHRPGTSGDQVSETLTGRGEMMHATPDTLPGKIRRALRRPAVRAHLLEWAEMREALAAAREHPDMVQEAMDSAAFHARQAAELAREHAAVAAE